jgi:hypothetical protein
MSRSSAACRPASVRSVAADAANTLAQAVPAVRADPDQHLKFAVERSPFAPVLREVRRGWWRGRAVGLVADGARDRARDARHEMGGDGTSPALRRPTAGSVTCSRRTAGSPTASGSGTPITPISASIRWRSRSGPRRTSPCREAPSAKAILGAAGGDFIRSVIGNLSDKTWLSGVSDSSRCSTIPTALRAILCAARRLYRGSCRRGPTRPHHRSPCSGIRAATAWLDAIDQPHSVAASRGCRNRCRRGVMRSGSRSAERGRARA